MLVHTSKLEANVSALIDLHCTPVGAGFYPRMPHRNMPDNTRRSFRGQSPLPQKPNDQGPDWVISL